jgi:hypothetical protein
MSYRPRIFISHSAKEQEAQTLCRAISRHLNTDDFEVLWDQANLQTSDAWRPAIDEWIWRCDAAILVISQAATESRYVAYEAALLRQRWKHRAQFLIIPIWCPGVDEKLLTDRMGALQLSEIQTNLKLAAWPANAANDPAAFDSVCRQAVSLLTTLKSKLQARSNAEDLLIKDLNLGTPSEDALAAIAADFNLPPMPSGAKLDLATVLARRILDFDAALGAQRFQALLAAIDTMKAAMTDSRDRVPRIVNLVAPFCWVTPAAAARLTALSSLPPATVRAVAWKRSWPLSERMYLYRGYCTRSPALIRIANVSDTAGGTSVAILAHIQSVLAKEVCRQPASDIQLAAKIKDLTRQGVPVFLLLPARAVDATILAEVSKRWPEVCMFLFGEELDEVQLREQFPGVEFVDPAPEFQDESDARTGWGDCMIAAGIPYESLEIGAAFL